MFFFFFFFFLISAVQLDPGKPRVLYSLKTTAVMVVLCAMFFHTLPRIYLICVANGHSIVI